MTTLSTDICIGDALPTQNNAKHANITDKDGNTLEYFPDEFMRIPFEPSTFSESISSRKIAIDITDATRKEFARLDAVLMVYISEHSERPFKKRMSLEQVRNNYSSPIHTSENHPSCIKTKVELGEGKYAVACWSEDGESIDLPESWRAYLIKPKIVVSSLWMFGSKFGPVLRLTDAMLQPKCEKDRCSPFKKRPGIPPRPIRPSTYVFVEQCAE